jgi:hypothetical protein
VTANSNAHRLAVDYGLRPLVASVGGLATARSIYVTDAQLPDVAVVPEPIDALTRELAIELGRVARALRFAPRDGQPAAEAVG